MYNIKIKSVPNKAKTGSQLDYSLVDRNTLFLKPDTQVQSDVKNTISAVPREEANIEAEGGETIIGDTNNDGFLEHQTIKGKRHTQGGVPLNVPEGSFIFSDTDKLRIKDPEILKMFGMAPNKKGYTPAEIAKKYQVNDYMAILKDDTKDKYSKETAQVMLDSNLKKLGMLALVQESMKGFPDGVPAIAESVMEGMMGGDAPEQQEFEQGQPEQQYGGTQLPKAQEGYSVGPYGKGFWQSDNAKTQPVEDTTSTEPVELPEVVVQKNNVIPRIGDEYYVNDQPVKISEIEKSNAGDWLPNWLNDPKGVYFSPSGSTNYNDKNRKYYLTPEEFLKLKQNPEAPFTKQGRTASSWWTADDNRDYNFSTKPVNQPTRTYDGLLFDQGDVINTDIADYKIIDTQYGVGENNPFVEPKGYFLPNLESIRAKNLTTGEIEELNLNQLSDDIKSGFSNNLTKNQKGSDTLMKIDATQGEKNSSGQDVVNKDAKVGKLEAGKQPVRTKPNASAQGNQTTTTSDIFKFGGLTKYQTGSTVNNTGKKVVSRVISSVTGNTRVTYSDGSTEIIPANVAYDVADEELRKNVGEKEYDFNELDPQYKYQHKTVGPQNKTTGYIVDKESGFYYHPDAKVGAPKPGAGGLANYMQIHKEAIDAFPGGAEAWKKTMIEAGGKENPAMSHLLEFENKAIGPIAGGKEYIDLNKRGARIPGVENFNLPGISKKQPPVTPQVAQTTTPSVQRGSPEIMQQAITPTIGRKTRGWFTPDMLNLANAFGRRTGNFPPTLQQVALESGPYNLLSPASEIARVQSSANQLTNQAMNTMAGNVGLTAGIGVQGQAADRVSDIAGKYGNTNVGISTDASRFGAGVFNQGQLANAELRDQFNTKNAIYGQQRINALNRKDDSITRAYNQAWGNAFKGNMLEDMFPQVGIDRVYGDIGWSGEGRNPFGVDTYINPMTAGASSKGTRATQNYDFDDTDMDQYEKLFNMASTKMSKENAHKFALQGITSNKKSRSANYDPYNPVAGMTEGLGNMGWNGND